MEQLCQDRNNPIKIALIGAGPSGIFFAVNILRMFREANFKNYFLYIFDKSKPLNTILPTGNGRCNISNNISDFRLLASNYPRGEKFLYSVFSRYGVDDTINFFNSIGIKTYVQDDNRIFPVENSSRFVRQQLMNELYKFDNFKIINEEIKDFSHLNKFDRVIIAVGSKSGCDLLKSTGHNIIPFKKALCSLNIKDNIFPQGVSVKSADGDFIFTKCGISGPLIYKISSLNSRKQFPYNLSIKLFDIDDIKKLVIQYPKKSIGNLVSFLIPRSLAKVIIDDFDKKASEVSKIQLESISKINFTVISAGNEGEIVNSGGVDLSELDKNYKSKIVNNLWFIGEAVDIDGFCGGFNLQNCWSSGYVAAVDVFNSIICSL